jgi:DNA polymerase-1
MEHLVYDIEGDGLLPELSTIHCIGVCVVGESTVQTYTDKDPSLPSIREGLERLKKAERLIGHNVIGYDMPAINKLYPGTLTFEQHWDTMVIAALVEPSRVSLSLASFGKQFGFPKGDFKDFSRYSDEMRVYMERDVELTARLYDHLQLELKKLYRQGNDYRPAIKLEHQVQLALALQAQHGFRFDVKAAEQLSVKLTEDICALEKMLTKVFSHEFRPQSGRWDFNKRTWIAVEPWTPSVNNNKLGYTKDAPLSRCSFDMFNPGSRQQVARRLNAQYGWKPTEFTDDGRPKLDESTLSTLDYPEARLLREYFRKSKQQGMLSEGRNAWLKLHERGRMHGYVRSCGSRTHRMSHSRPNMAQVDKSKAMRSLFLPDEGHVLVGCDADALELRMLASYLHKYDKGAYAEAVLRGKKEEGTDPHTINQKAAGLHSRDNAKTLYYALIYGAGDTKIGSIVADDLEQAGEVPPSKAKFPALGRLARQRIESGVLGLGELIASIQQQAGEKGYVTLPDGRRAASAQRTALNTLLQGSGSILMKQALALFLHELTPSEGLEHGKDFALLANVHDEQQLSVVPDKAELVGGLFAMAINLAGRRLELPVPFAGDYQIGSSWAETH